VNNHECAIISVFDTVEKMNRGASLESLLAMLECAADEYCETQNEGLFIPVVYVDADKLIHNWLLSKS
jgi:predicted RNase H-like HicB family nuclease